MQLFDCPVLKLGARILSAIFKIIICCHYGIIFIADIHALCYAQAGVLL